MDTKSGKKINSYPNFWKVCGFSYSSITSSQSYKCQQKLLPCEFMERAYKNYRKGSSVTERIAPACKSSLRITRCKKSGRLGKGGCMLNYGNVWGIITCDKIFSVMLVLLPQTIPDWHEYGCTFNMPLFLQVGYIVSMQEILPVCGTLFLFLICTL